MRPVIVLLFHAPPPPDAGPLTHVLAAARAALADAHRSGFLAAGADDVRIIADAGHRAFGARLRSAAADLPVGAGAVILGSGSLPLATAADRRLLVAAAAGDEGTALANNRYSGDAVALPDAAAILAALPDLPGDNALPRWLVERRGLRVADLRLRPHLQADLDGPADLVLLARSRLLPARVRAVVAAEGAWAPPLRGRIAAVEMVARDPRAEMTVTGRVSAAGLTHLERATACRVRALVEERGLRAASSLAQGPSSAWAGTQAGLPAAPVTPGADPLAERGAAQAAGVAAPAPPARPARPPASVLGIALDAAGPAGLGALLARLGDAAIVDSRVLLAHVVGVDERLWPSLEDRLASDLLLPDRIADPWLRALTESAVAASIPVLLGGHSLVGPGLRLLFPSPRDGPASGAARSPGGGESALATSARPGGSPS